MSILSIDFFVFLSHVDLKITISFPFLFKQLNFCHFLTEDSIADDASKQSITNILVFFVLVHEASEEDWEIDDISEESL